MINFWKRLNAFPESSLAKKALQENVNMRTNWIKTIEKLLHTFNLIEFTGDTQKFKLASKTNANKFYISIWDAKMKSDDLTRLKFYQTLKNDFIPATYISIFQISRCAKQLLN